jgi:hypothetical protein
VNVESPHGRAGPTLTTISYPTCALTTQKPYSQKAAETVLCCKCWKPIERDDGVTIQFVYAVAAYHKSMFYRSGNARAWPSKWFTDRV